jgi:RimJ/RimL family protein N-acetyltransferase
MAPLGTRRIAARAAGASGISATHAGRLLCVSILTPHDRQPAPVNQTLPTLDSARVRLRQLSVADLDDLHAVFSDVRAMRYWSTPAFADISRTREYLAAIDAGRERGDLLQWGIEHVAAGRIIGTTTLFHIDREQGRAEIGYILASAYWGQGLANEALTRVLQHARDDMQMRRIEADVDPRNDASLRCSVRLGFVREGYARERWVVSGEIQDAVLLGLLLRDLVIRT